MKYYVLGFFAIVLIIGLSLVGWVWGTYNNLATQNQMVATSWADVQTQYQRRFDLIPNLVNATKGILVQEQKVFGAIADARTHYANSAPNSKDQVQATSQLDGALSRLLVVMENYPVLKSNENVKALTDEIAGTENRIAVSRDRYNQQVLTFNTLIVRFPGNLIAGMFGFQQKEFFKADTTAQAAPTVNLTN
jgi:LemA protein